MADAFENILGQPQVREFLRATVAQDRVSHAYLFTGPAGSNKTLAAYGDHVSERRQRPAGRELRCLRLLPAHHAQKTPRRALFCA